MTNKRRLPQILIALGIVGVGVSVSDAPPTGFLYILGVAGYIVMVSGCIWLGLISFRRR
jgi:hypothetical protein